jgi:hypothetical protein
MIHLHSMFASETNPVSIGQNSHSAPLSQAKLDSFHGALSDAVSSTLEKFGIHPNAVKISITSAGRTVAKPVTTNPEKPVRIAPPASGATSSGSSSASAGSAPASSTTSGPPNGGYDPFLQAAYNNPYANAPLQYSTQPTTQNAAPEDAQQAYDDSYWASQPPPVQALRTMQNQEQREATATQLANEGYSIDVPIMVWGWDPSITTAMRQSDGYTWVPSALQASVEVAPGLSSVGTLAAYNPNNPPPGSIAV